MRLDALASWTLPVCLLLGAAPGCQGYAFEELPSSVIREKRIIQEINTSNYIDIIFVIDNSRSMVGEQLALAKSFETFVGKLDDNFGEGKYRIAVITTGVDSPGCQLCDPNSPGIYGCLNETGEHGRFQDRRGRHEGGYDFSFVNDRSCRIVDSSNLDCFFDPVEQRGTVLVGINGCGYERGLEPLRIALSEPLSSTYNTTQGEQEPFLRPNATLAVVVVTDEEDCGAVGDVTEEISGTQADICYFAATGIGPDGGSFHPDDPTRLEYHLTPVVDYYNFLMGLKDDRVGLVKFAAIVGVSDPDNPTATRIEYDGDTAQSGALPACETHGDCDNSAGYCVAFPGTRYVELADLFGIGENAFVDTICQDDEDFSDTMAAIGDFVACPREFGLSEKPMDPALANILINDEPVPRYACTATDEVVICEGPKDSGTCPGGECAPTWSYHEPGENEPEGAEGGWIRFADHYDACELITEGVIKFEVIYVTE